jgi:cob(I)alamin adenosyltransferase
LGNRLSKIYTRTGDDGTTGLGTGERVSKDSLRIEACGALDELNSALGVMIAAGPPEQLNDMLGNVQQTLFDLGGEISLPGSNLIDAEKVLQLESAMDQLNEVLPPLKDFIMPGGNAAGAACHMARAICRRAERRLVSLAQQETINEHAVHYINRLSDFLFILARTLNRAEGIPEILWESPGRNEKG